MGITFKEDCPDIRNSKAYKLYKKLYDNRFYVDVIDPSREDVKYQYNIDLKYKINKNFYDAIIIAVPNSNFRKLGINKIVTYAKKEINI